MKDHGQGTDRVPVERVTAAGVEPGHDSIAIEEPMEIRLAYAAGGRREERSLSVTMRTPGRDFELAAGFLFTEGVVAGRDQIEEMRFCGPVPEGRDTSNIVRVRLREGVTLDLERLQRNFYTTSSCGICGKASLEAVQVQGITRLEDPGPRVAASVVHVLPGRLLESQAIFERTGGLHAAGLFDAAGRLLDVHEDVGRHNAVDKLIGAGLLKGEVPLEGRVLVVSGRASFEILQKALTARIPIAVAVGAPSSLAVELAREFGMTLVGFARDGRFNVYAGAERISGG